MERNPSYGDPVYEDIEVLPCRGRSTSSIQYTNLVDSDTQEKTAVHASKACKIKRCLMVTAVVVIISLLVLILVGVIVLAGNSRVEIAQLEMKIVQLEQQLNLTKQQSQEQFNKLEETQQALNDSVDNLTTRVNSAVNLYQNCIQETSNCIAVPGSSHCVTPSLVINSTGYYTTDMRCEYESNKNYFHSINLWTHDSDNNVWCDCFAKMPSQDTSSYYLCTLVVTRCPTTVHLP